MKFVTSCFLSFLLLSSLVVSSNIKQDAAGAAITREISSSDALEPIKLDDAFCFINYKGAVYDLTELKNDTADYEIKSPFGDLHFNICRNLINPCEEGKDSSSSYIQKSITETTCSRTSGPTVASNKIYLLQDKNEKGEILSTELRMVLPPGDTCKANPQKKYETTINLTCAPDADVVQISKSPFEGTSCDIQISVRTKYACPNFDVYALWNQVQDNKWIFGSLILAAGIFFCFFGEEFVKASQIIAGGAVVLILFLYVVFNYTTIPINTWQFWLIIVIALAVGCAAGYFMSLISWLPGVVFGTLLGFIVGFFVFNLMLRFIHSNPAAVFWTSMIVCIGLGVLLAWYKNEEILIISTSVVGAYAIIRGFSIWFGNFPDERQVYELGTRGEWDQLESMLSMYIYAYLAGFLVLAAGGMFIQFKFFYDGNKNKAEGEKEKLNENENKPATA